MTKKQPLEQRVEPLLKKINALPRSGVKADKAFFDDLSGEADRPRPSHEPSRENADKVTISPEEMERRRFVVEQAETHNRLEGLQPSPEMLEIIEDYIQGRIELEDILPRVKAIYGTR